MASGEVESGEEKSYWGIASKPCDSCGSAPSVLFCRADAAFLCGACDSRVHSANRLASRHDRVWLCEVCEQAPAAVTCKADAASLCASCDADIHSANPLAGRHERVPVAPLSDSPDSSSKIYRAREGGAALEGEGEVVDFDLKSADYFFADADQYVDLDHADSLVPVQPAKAHVSVGAPAVQPAAASFDFAAPQPSYSAYSVCSSDVGVVPDAAGDASTGYAGGRPGAQASMDREARVMRYREKRKNRKFEKTIRYASRKAYAETRPRIKGRFAKRAEAEAEVEGLYSSPPMVAGMMGDGGYGIVPSF